MFVCVCVCICPVFVFRTAGKVISVCGAYICLWIKKVALGKDFNQPAVLKLLL